MDIATGEAHRDGIVKPEGVKTAVGTESAIYLRTTKTQFNFYKSIS